MSHYLNIGVIGFGCWPTEETKTYFGGHELILMPATKDTEQSVHINLKDITNIEALTLINRFLSTISWCDNQGMENIYGWSGNPVPVAVPKRPRAIGSSTVFPFGREMEENPKARLALALFREGLTINSGPFAFLSYFKILNIFWKDKRHKDKNEIVEGIRNHLEGLTDKLATERLSELKNREADVAEYLYKSGRCAIAHAYSEPIVDPDDVHDLRRLSQDVHIIKEIAEHLISNELNVSRTLY